MCLAQSDLTNFEQFLMCLNDAMVHNIILPQIGTGAAEHVVPDLLSASTGRGSPDESAEAINATQGPAKKAKTVTLSWAQLGHRAVALPDTAEDVMELRRLGPDLFEATKRSGESWVGDAELLRALPQGIAKLATLQVRELMRDRKDRAVDAISSGGKSAEPPTKKPRTLQEDLGTRDLGAAKDVDHKAVAEATSQEKPSCEIGPVAAVAQEVPWLFCQGTGKDHVLLEWLRAHVAQPRCNSLLKQVFEWASHLARRAARKLYILQGTTISRESQATTELLLEAVRKHFREATSQEKGQLVTLNLARHPLFPVGSGATEHAADAEQRMTAAAPAKKPRTLQEDLGRRDLGAAEHVDHMAVAEATAQEEPSREIGPLAAVAQEHSWLFRQGRGKDNVLL